jgi:Na+/melibiose symporter-like transporter
MVNESERPVSVSIGQCFAYAMPLVSLNLISLPTAGIMTMIYAKYYGLSLSAIAMVLLVGRLFDAVTDPVIGVLSDRYHHNRGTRKPFIVLGGLLSAACAWFLYIPPQDVSVIYFLACYLAFQFSTTLIEIPHMTWAGEIVADSKGKTRIYSIRMIVLNISSFVFFAIPMLPLFDSGEFTPEFLELAVISATVLMPIVLYVSVSRVPDGGHSDVRKKDSLRQIRDSVIQNRPLLILLGSFLMQGLGTGMAGGMLFLYVDAYLGLGEKLPTLMMAGGPIAIVAIPCWTFLANRYGKKRIWTLCTLLMSASILAGGFLKPNVNAFFYLTMILGVAFFCVPGTVLAQSIMADIVDYGTWKFGIDRGATYFAAYSLVLKANAALGTAIGMIVAGVLGFDATSITQTIQGIWGIKLGYSFIPVFFCLSSLLLIAMIPINERRHAIIRRRLDQRERRQAVHLSTEVSTSTSPSDPVRQIS